jgi:hypothetical protein
VANRTVPPMRSGTCRNRRLGFVAGGLLAAVVFGNLNVGVLVSELSTTGVAGIAWLGRLGVGSALALGLAGKVEYGPSVVVRLLGGLPLTLPAEKVPLLGQADETAGPCLLLGRADDGVMAD